MSLLLRSRWAWSLVLRTVPLCLPESSRCLRFDQFPRSRVACLNHMGYALGQRGLVPVCLLPALPACQPLHFLDWITSVRVMLRSLSNRLDSGVGLDSVGPLVLFHVEYEIPYGGIFPASVLSSRRLPEVGIGEEDGSISQSHLRILFLWWPSLLRGVLCW